MSKRELHTELTGMHIMALYDFMNPVSWDAFTWEDVQKRIEIAENRYLNDHIFAARVQSMVSNTMFLVEKHCVERDKLPKPPKLRPVDGGK